MRRARPLGAANGTRLRLWKAGPGDKRGHLCPGQYYPGPGGISTRLHSHVKGSTAHPGHTASLLIFCVLSGVPLPPFPCRLVSKDLPSHSPLSPPPFLPGPLCQRISAPPWPHKCHTTISCRFSHSHPHIRSCHQQTWEKSHRITLCHLESTFERKTLPSLASCFTSPAQRVQPSKGNRPLSTTLLHESSAAGADSINSCK